METMEAYREEALWLIGSISEKLIARNLLLGTAESCTGGLVASLCTDVAGSSGWFAGSVVAYADSVKTGMLRVSSGMLKKWGAVSEPVVRAMAQGAVDRLGVQVSLALSGIAGPGGGTPEKPVGTVWLAAGLLMPGGRKPENFIASGSTDAALKVVSVCRHYPGDRTEVRIAAALDGLKLVRDILA